MYHELYPNDIIDHVPVTMEVFSGVSVLGEKYISIKTKGNHSSCVVANWSSTADGNKSLMYTTGSDSYHAGEILYFSKHRISIQRDKNSISKYIVPIFANVYWFENHPCENAI